MIRLLELYMQTHTHLNLMLMVQNKNPTHFPFSGPSHVPWKLHWHSKQPSELDPTMSQWSLWQGLEDYPWRHVWCSTNQLAINIPFFLCFEDVIIYLFLCSAEFHLLVVVICGAVEDERGHGLFLFLKLWKWQQC